jgi:hypothetical protein
MLSLGNDKGECYESGNYFAELYNVTRRTVIEWTRELRIAGYVRIESFGNKRKIIIPKREKFLSQNVDKMRLREKFLSQCNVTYCVSKTSYNKDSSKEHSTKSEKTQRKTKFFQECMELWNSFPHVPHHMNPDTKRAKKLQVYFNQLLRGRFHEGKRLNNDFLSRNKIPTILLSNKFTEQEIQDVLGRMSNYFMEGYLPFDKKKLPHDLPSLLFNPRTNTSHFLKAFINSPVLISDKITDRKIGELEQMIEEFPKIHKIIIGMFVNLIGKDRLKYSGRIEKLIEGVEGLIKYNVTMPNRENDTVNSKYGTPLKMCRKYIDWIEEQDWIDRAEPGMVSVKSKTFSMFLTECEKELYGLSLRVNDNGRRKVRRRRKEQGTFSTDDKREGIEKLLGVNRDDVEGSYEEE